MDPQKLIIHKSVVDVLPQPHRSCKVSQPPKRYIGLLTEKVEKMFLMKDKDHGDDSNTFNEVMFDINFEKWLDVMKSKIDSMHSNQV